jgi:hypothetical protein
MKISKVLILMLFPIAALAQPKASKDLKKLHRFMLGQFSSEVQSKSDSTYFDIRLSITPIWTDRNDAFWMVVEQATASSLQKPYRQRIYRLTEKEKGVFESAVFTFDKPLRFAGKAQEINTTLTPDSLQNRTGCEVILKKKDRTSFTGGTVEKNCPSDLRSAKYATSIVTITKDAMLSWDQGFNEKNEQVWGATKGGYLFLKEK